jgi:hypothetical protein
MSADHPDVSAFEDPQAKLERAFIDEFLRARGYEGIKLSELPVAQRELVMKQASSYASGRLSEVDARARFVHEIHGAEHARKLPITPPAVNKS